MRHGRKNGGRAQSDSYIEVRLVAIITLAFLLLALVLPLMLADDWVGDNLSDAWKEQYGLSTNVYDATNLVGWWQLNGTNSTDQAVDRSGNGINGTLSGFPTDAYGPGLFDNALYFTTNGAVTFPTTNSVINAATNAFTFSAWFQTTNTAVNSATIATWSDAGTNAWSVTTGTNGVAAITFSDSGGNQTIGTSTNEIPVYDGNWHQIVATYDTNQVATVYVDGETQASGTITDWTPGPTASFTFGFSVSSSANQPFVLDEARLYNRALGSNEIDQLPYTYSDLNGSGLTIYDDYLEGLDPISTNGIVTSGFIDSGLASYYGGSNPTLTKTSGDGQSIAPSTFATDPLVVHVANSSGTALTGAPITFSIPSGSYGGVSQTNGGTTTTSLSLTTDTNGNATAYYEAGVDAPTTNTITATAVSDVGSTSASFTEYGEGPSGLVFWLEADAGVTSDTNGDVSAWADQTGNYPVTQSTSGDQPTYVASDINGEPALRFNGSQWLFNASNMGLNNDMTIIVVAAPNDDTYGFDPMLFLGDNTTAASRSLDYNGGYEMFDGGGGDSCTGGTEPELGQFIVEACTVDADLTDITFYQNGTESGAGTVSTLQNMVAGITVGAYADGGEPWQGDISEVLVYNRELSSTELQQVGVYLADKYGLYNPNATWPLAYSSEVQAEITLHQWSQAQANAYVTFESSNPTMLTNGLMAWFKADAGVTTDTNGNVSAWADQTGNYPVTQSTSGNEPSYVTNDINGEPALRFNGSQWLFNASNMGLNNDMTLIAVASPNDSSYGFDPIIFLGDNTTAASRGLTYNGGYEMFDGGGYDTCNGGTEPGLGQFIVEACTVDPDLTDIAFYQNGTESGAGTVSTLQNMVAGITVGAYADGGEPWQGDISELLVYDHQLSSAELQQVGVYLADKYGLYNPNATWPLAYGSAVQEEITAYQWNKSQADTYAAFLAANPDLPIPASGLQLWLEANEGLATDTNNNVQQWVDQSPWGHIIGQDSSAGGPPVLQNDSQGNPTLRFNGNQALWCADYIPANQDVSIVMVEEADNPQNFTMSFSLGGQNSGGSTRAYANQSGEAEFDVLYGGVAAGTAANPYEEAVNTVTYQRSSGNVDFYLRGSANGSGNVGVNDLSSGLVIGDSVIYNIPWTGTISEILVYDHVLSSDEQNQVEGYLADKYGIYSANATWPEFYSSEVQAQVIVNQWDEAQAAAYAAFLAANPDLPVPASDLVLWLKADEGVTTDTNGNVSQWQDQAPGAHVAAQTTVTNEPQIVTDTNTGEPTLLFNGNQWLSSTDQIPANQDLTIITVAEIGTTGTQMELVALGLNPSIPGSMRGYGYQSSQPLFDTYDYYVQDGMEPPAGQPVITTMTYSRGTGDTEFYEYGASNGSENIGVNDLASGFTVGEAGWNGGYWSGSIAEVLVYSSVLTDNERNRVEGYLADKYGIYSANATWPLAYGTDVQAQIEANDWNQTQAAAYAAYLAANPDLPVPASDLVLWLKADEGVTTDTNGNVSQWQDQAPGAHVAAQTTVTNEPQIVTDTNTGEPTLLFNGNQWLSSTDQISANQDVTIVTVSEATTTGTQMESVALGLNPSIPSSMRGYGYQSSQALFDTYDYYVQAGAQPPAGQPVVTTMTYSRNTGDTEFYAYGASNGSENIGGNDLTSGFTIGEAGWNGGYWSGSIAEVLVYSSVLTDNERNQVEGYLADKYGIYSANATWLLAYSTDVQALIATNQWTENQTNGYVTAYTPVISSATTATGAVGAAFSYTIAASNTPTSFNATGLPGGLSIDTSTGIISGTPTVTGTSSVTITATNAVGTGTASLTLTISPSAPVIISATTATGITSTTFSYTIVASSSPTSYNATGLPTGLSVDTGTGVISGTPTTTGTSTVTISATNAEGTGTANLTLQIEPVLPVTSGLTAWFSADYGVIQNSGTQVVNTWQDRSSNSNDVTQTTSGMQPTLVTDPGTGRSAINFNGSQIFTNSNSFSSVNDVTIFTVVSTSGQPSTTEGQLVMGTLGAGAKARALSYNNSGEQLLNLGGGPTFGSTVSVTGGTVSLPVELNINAVTYSSSTGTANFYINGIANGTGTASAGEVTTGLKIGSNGYNDNWNGNIAEMVIYNRVLSSTELQQVESYLAVKYTPIAQPIITSPTTASGITGSAFSYTITAGDSPTSFNATGLPSGLSINATTGVISGTPTAPGTSTVTIGATNAGGTGTATLTLTVTSIQPVITSPTTATGPIGVAFNYTIEASNVPTSFNATGLPSGLSINATTGVILGIPTASGTSSVTISATNVAGTYSQPLTLIIYPSTPVVNSATAVAGITGTAFSYQITASNLPASFDATGLPSGLSIDTTTGLISGTPTSAGSSTVTISATNDAGTGTAILTLTIQSATAPVIDSATTDGGTAGITFSYSIAASNSPTSYNATGLPSGLSINTATGVISGTPTTVGTSTVSLSAINAFGTGTAILKLTIGSQASPVINISTTSVGTVGLAFNYTISASNTPASYSATGLPSGLSLDTATGIISGTPTTTGAATVTLSATNAWGTGTATLTIVIYPALPVTSGLTAWFNAATGVATTNGSVTEWDDQSGNGYNIAQTTESNAPTYGNDSATGLPVVQFDGSQWIGSEATLSTINDVTIITVASTPYPSASEALVDIGYGYNMLHTRALAYSSGNESFVNGWPNGASAQFNNGGPVAQTDQLTLNMVTYSNSTGQANFYSNGIPDGLVAVNTGTINQGLSLGSLSYLGSYYGWNGNIGDVLIYDRVLSSYERQQLSLYFIDKYGIYTSSATWPLAYSADIQALIAENQWTEAETNAYLASLGSSVRIPTVSPNPGRYASSQTITVTSATSDATIYYTTDGSTPTTGSSSIANGGQLTVSSTTQFNFMAATSDGSTSSIATAIYQIGNSGSLAAGDSFTMVLKPNGTVWTWGDDSRGQQGDDQAHNPAPFPQQISSLSGIISVAASGNHALAADSSGNVWAWGADDQSQGGDGGTTDLLVPTQISGLSNIISVYAGQFQGFAVDNSGNLYAWGDNSNGQLGDGTTTNQIIPEAVTSISGVLKVAAGSQHTLVLKSDGTVWATGSNTSGQLGNGTQNNATSFQRVPGLANMIDIAAGAAHSMALRSDGTVWTWGNNSNGQLGNGTTTNSLIPQQVLGLPFAIAIVAVDTKTYVILADGMVACFGGGAEGEMGVGNDQDELSPVNPSGISNVTALAAGSDHAVICTSSGAFYGWGDNTSFKLTEDFSNFFPNTEVHDNDFQSYVGVASAGTTTIGLNSDGTVWAVGNGSYGTLGQGNWSSTERPIQITGLSGITRISAGENTAFAIDGTGTLWAWGENTNGQLGLSNNTNQDIPTAISTSYSVTAVAAGDTHLLVCESNGTVWASGDDSHGELGDGTTTAENTLDQIASLSSVTVNGVAAGSNTSFALDSTGIVWAWGQNNLRQLGLGTSGDVSTPTPITGLPTMASIAARGAGGMGIDTSGNVWSWGAMGNTNGTPVEQTLTNVKVIAAGNGFQLAIESNGTIWGWGNGSSGQLGNGSYANQSHSVQLTDTQGNAIHGVVAAAAGDATTAIVKEDGSLTGFGKCDTGQLGAGLGTFDYSPKPIFNFAMTETPPSVSITSPSADATVVLGTNINLQASASASTGSITEVDYYLEGVQIGSSTAGGTWNFTWTPPTYGDFTFEAVAYDSAGVSQISSPITINVPYDSDDNGLPDWWELEYLGQLGNNPDTSSPDGNGLTLLQDYQAGTDPTSGVFANLAIFSGNDQTGPSGAYLPYPLIVSVTNLEGQPVAGDAVTFTVTAGGGVLSASSLTTPTSTIQITTDTNGQAQVWLQQPLVANLSSTVSATINTLSMQNTVTFSASTPVDNRAPASASSLTAQIASSSEIDLAWTNNADNATSILVQQQNSDESWSTVATLAPTQNSNAVTGLTLGNTYNFQIVTSNAIGQSTTTLNAPITLGAPAAPSGLIVAQGGPGEIDLSWANNATNASSILIEESTDGVTWTPIATLSPNQTSYTVTGSTSDQSYYYQEVAVNNSGDDGAVEESPDDSDDPADNPDASSVTPPPVSLTGSLLTLYCNSGDNTDGFSLRLPDASFSTDGTELIGASGGGWYALPVTATGDFKVEFDVYGNSGDVDSDTLLVDDETNAGILLNNCPQGTDTPNLNVCYSDNFTNSSNFFFPSDVLSSAGSTSFPNETWVHVIITKKGNTLTDNVGGQIITADLTDLDLSSTLRIGLGYYATTNDGGVGNIEYKNIKVTQCVHSELAVDANRDGTIVLANENPSGVDVDGNPVDSTSQANPFAFWINNGVDGPLEVANIPANLPGALVSTLTAGFIKPPPSSEIVQANLDPNRATVNPLTGQNDNPNYEGGKVTCTRDLENFARLWMYTKGLCQAITSGQIVVGLEWQSNTGDADNGWGANDGAPAINIYLAAPKHGSSSVTGGADYLTNPDTANDQASSPFGISLGTVAKGQPFYFDPSYFAKLSSTNPKTYFLFEGAASGTGRLVVTFNVLNSDDTYTKVGEGGQVYMNLQDIKQLYERWTVGDGPSPNPASVLYSGGGLPWPQAEISTNNLPAGMTQGFQYNSSTPGLSIPTDPNGNKYILFIHGYNMEPWEKDAFAATALKRLYWQGYKGKFGAFQWPTTYSTETGTNYARASALDFDMSEYSAWLSGPPLAHLLQQLNSQTNGVYVLAHSHGNVLMGEALRLSAAQSNQPLVSAYVASQAALPIQCYDPDQATPNGFFSALSIEPEGDKTPNIYPNWMKSNNTASPSISNFYNVNDWALSNLVWQTDERTKPDQDTGPYPPYGYTGDPDAPPVAEGFYNSKGYVLIDPERPGDYLPNYLSLADASGINDQYEIMSFAAQAHCLAMGTVATKAENIVPYDLQQVWGDDPYNNNFRDHVWHSGEFEFSNSDPQMQAYWSLIMARFGLPTNPLPPN